MMSDTASFFYGMPDAGSGIVQLQEHFAGMEQLQSAPMVFSMHYSAKNSVSFLQVMSLAEGVAEQVAEGLQSKATSRRK